MCDLKNHHQNRKNVNTNYEPQTTARMDFEIKSGCNGLKFSVGNSENTAATLDYGYIYFFPRSKISFQSLHSRPQNVASIKI
jgi:hypothetical protein